MDVVELSSFTRPAKLCFIVRNDDDTKKAMSICSVLWGGVFNEIHSTDNILDENYLSHCDYVVRFEEDLKKEEDSRLISYNDLINSKDTKEGPRFFDIVPIYHSLRDAKISTVFTKTEPKFCDIFRFGCFPLDSERKFAEAYTKILSPKENTFSAETPSNGNERISPLEITGFNLFLPGGRETKRSIVFVLGPNDCAKTAAICWTLRARGHGIVWVDDSDIQNSMERSQKWVDDFIQNLKERQKKRNNVEWPASVRLCSVGYKKESEIVKNAITMGKFHGLSELNYLIDTPESVFDIFPRTEEQRHFAFLQGTHLTFKHPYPEFVYDNKRKQTIGVSFEVPRLYKFGENSFLHSIPNVENPEKYLLTHSLTDGVSIHGDVITKFETHYDFNQSIWLHDNQEFWRRFFWDKDLDLKQSPPGNNFANIISKYGGVDPGCRFLKVRAVTELIRLLQNDNAATKGQIWKVVARFLEDKPELGLHHITKENFFDEMCERGVIRQGYNLTCSKCQNTSWYSIKDIADQWTCRFCDFTSRTTFLSETKSLAFKADGLFQLRDNAQGAFTSILALWLFNHLERSSNKLNFVSSFDLLDRKTSTKKIECDLLINMNDRRDEGTIVLVESKSFNDVEKKDVEQMDKLSSLIGPKAYRCFATLKANFSAEELALFKTMYEKNPRLILLTYNELAPYDLDVDELFPGYSERFRDKYIFNLGSLSQATVFKHLKPDTQEIINQW